MAKYSKGGSSVLNRGYSCYPAPDDNQGAPVKGVSFNQDNVEVKSFNLAGVGGDARPRPGDMDPFGLAKKVESGKVIDGDAAKYARQKSFGPAPVEKV